MSKKVLYLGEGKWCYTQNCKQHSPIIEAKKGFVEAQKNGDTVAVQETKTVLLGSKEGQATLYSLLAKNHHQRLGRPVTIGLDLDGTTGDFSHGLRWHMVTKDGLNIPEKEWRERYPDLETYDYHLGENRWFDSREEFLVNFQAGEKRGLYRQMPMYKNAAQTLKELKRLGVKTKVVTARNALYNPDSKSWLTVSGVEVENIYNPGHAKETIKNVDVYLDDAPVVVNRLIEHNKKVVIMNQKYNVNGLNENGNTKRVQNWEDNVVGSIFDLLDEKKK